MTKQGAHGDHFLPFLILNAIASGFSMSWAEAPAYARTDLASRIRISSRGNGHVIYCCWGGATGGGTREGRDKMTENSSLWNRMTLLIPLRNQLCRDWAERPERHPIL